MEEHLAIHIFACPFEKCRTVGGPPKSFSALKAHVKKYHSMREKMRPLFMPVDAAMSGPSRLEKLPNPVPFYKLGQPLIHSKRRKASATSDNDQTAIDQLTPSFSQEARRPRAEPWKDKDYTRIQDGTRLRDAYALDDGRRLGIHDTWEVSLANVVPLNTSTSAGDRPKKQHRPDHRGRR
ncbi:uncharacterized protein FA14DRAFT_152639 [Meira miltonrushii]|uniref:Uncharacterized protein n=1 Tax=Meira miltonrushii TaxID=1280837 RepID=A0A316VJ33_9BASI|nr:uncharacterized protein FA14DRAFT_152639 [Meira miltonrushii]PWN37234.1 hypothetical protein FA14DRAFT_152639 [Meira miltonrushii]